MPSRRTRRTLDFARLYGAGPLTIERIVQEGVDAPAPPGSILPWDVVDEAMRRAPFPTFVESDPILAPPAADSRVSIDMHEAIRRTERDVFAALTGDPVPTEEDLARDPVPAPETGRAYLGARPMPPPPSRRPTPRDTGRRVGTSGRVLQQGGIAYAFRRGMTDLRSDGAVVRVERLGPNRTRTRATMAVVILLKDWADTNPQNDPNYVTSDVRHARTVRRRAGDMLSFEVGYLVPRRAAGVHEDGTTHWLEFTTVYDDEQVHRSGAIQRRRREEDDDE